MNHEAQRTGLLILVGHGSYIIGVEDEENLIISATKIPLTDAAVKLLRESIFFQEHWETGKEPYDPSKRWWCCF